MKRHRTATLLLCSVGLCVGFAPTAHTQTKAPTQTPLYSERDAPLPSAKTSLPQLGLSADEFLSLREEKTLGLAIWRDLRGEPEVMSDPLITAYLQAMVHTLSASIDLADPVQFKTFAVADGQLNAFAMPSGLMGVHTGLMLSVAREDELAAVLAHEIGHVSQRHFARGLANKKDDRWIALAGFAAAIVAARNNSTQSGQVIEGALAGSQALALSRQLTFSRDMEREADAIGFALMRQAQYDGADMVRMLRRLGAASSFSESATVYAKSHPGTTERMANIEGRLRMGSVPNISARSSNVDFLLMQARVRALLANTPELMDAARSLWQTQLSQPNPPTSPAHRLAAQYGLSMLSLKTARAQGSNAISGSALSPTIPAALMPVLVPVPVIAADASAHPWVQALAYEQQLHNKAGSAVGASTSSSSLDLHTAVRPMLDEKSNNSNNSNKRNSTAHAAAALHMVQSRLNSLSTDPNLSVLDQAAAQAVLALWLKTQPQDDTAWAALATLYGMQKNAQSSAMALWAQAQQAAAMGVWLSSINLLNQALRAGETNVPIAVQNQWRDRLIELRQMAADEKTVLERFK